MLPGVTGIDSITEIAVKEYEQGCANMSSAVAFICSIYAFNP